jgi:hypoxanthine phosphoribosyltransferase
MTPHVPIDILLSNDEIAQKIDAVAHLIRDDLGDDLILMTLLTGGMWFAADLSRALSRLGVRQRFEALWLSSYGDEMHAKTITHLAGPQRLLKDANLLIVDDVYDTGASLRFAVQLAKDKGAKKVKTAVMAAKAASLARGDGVDYHAWLAPDKYLVGYGLDYQGYYRELPYIGALLVT